MLGCEITVPCLDGPYKLKIDSGTQSGTILRLRGKGLPAVSGYGSGKGDLYVQIVVWIPRKLNKDEKNAIENMRKNDNLKPDLNRDDKNLIENFKKLFDE